MAELSTKASAWGVAFALIAPAPLPIAAQQAAQQAPATATQGALASAPFKQEELEQLVAPIALYPDPLLAQVLMASTYPLEVVQAARWAKVNPRLSGKALEDAMQNEPWDPSVKSLTVVPQVLEMMENKLDWTQKLGDAFLAQQSQVLNAVQTLRAKASAAGHLKSTPEQTVTTTQEGGETVIVIEPAGSVVYVPTYDPAYVYGPWPYPAYPPYYWYPPGYYYPAGGFLAGIIIGSWLWGGCNWGGGGGLHVEHHRYNEFNRTNISDGNWRHNVEHRKGVAYRDQATASRFDRDFSRDAAAREQFRGRAEQGRAEMRQGDFAGRLDSAGVGNRGDRGAGGAAGVADRGDFSRANRGDFSGANQGAFDGVGNSAATRDISNRGNASRESMGRTGSGFSGGGGRMGGGGRGGGGRR